MDCLHGKVHSSTLEEGMNCLASHWSLSFSICQPHFHQNVVAIGCCSHCIFMVAAMFLWLAHVQLGNQSDVARGCLQGRSASRLPVHPPPKLFSIQEVSLRDAAVYSLLKVVLLNFLFLIRRMGLFLEISFLQGGFVLLLVETWKYENKTSNGL